MDQESPYHLLVLSNPFPLTHSLSGLLLLLSIIALFGMETLLLFTQLSLVAFPISLMCYKCWGVGRGRSRQRAAGDWTSEEVVLDPRTGAEVVEVTEKSRCPLCKSKVNGKDWLDGSHRAACAKKHPARLRDLTSVSYPGVPCGGCGGALALWDDVEAPVSFACGGAAPGCHMQFSNGCLLNNGRNLFMCFQCNYRLCLGCCEERDKDRERTSRATATLQAERRASRDRRSPLRMAEKAARSIRLSLTPEPSPRPEVSINVEGEEGEEDGGRADKPRSSFSFFRSVSQVSQTSQEDPSGNRAERPRTLSFFRSISQLSQGSAEAGGGGRPRALSFLRSISQERRKNKQLIESIVRLLLQQDQLRRRQQLECEETHV